MNANYSSPDAEVLQWEMFKLLCDSVNTGNEGYGEEIQGSW